MKSLLALLVLGLLLGFGYWKTQHPDATMDDLSAGASSGVNRLKGGFAAFADGGASQSAMKERLETIEQELVETQRAADPTVINGRLTDAERRMDATESKLGDIDTKLSAVESGVSSLESSVGSVDTAVASLTSGPNAVSTQVSAIDDRLELLSRRIDEQSDEFNATSINSALAELSNKIDTLQDNQRRSSDDQSVALAGMDEKISAFEARLNTLSSDASSGQAEAVASINAQIDQRIALLENKLGTTQSDSLRIDSMTNELSASRVKVNALEAVVSETKQQLSDLNRSINALKTQSESSSIDDQQAQIRNQLKELQSQLNQVGDNTNVTDLTVALQTTRDRIQSLEQRVVDLPASSSAATDATEAQSALQAQIKALESKLANIETSPDPTLVNSISAVEEKVSELAAKSYVTQEELRAQQQAKSNEYKIYFDRNSTAITEEAGKVLNSFIAQEKNRTTGVSIYGFTDRRGSAVYNQRLALQRATNVRSYLIQNGFSYTKIKSLSGLGEDAAAANLPDGEEDAQQRAVVLYAVQP